MLKTAGDHDMATFDQPHPPKQRLPNHGLGHLTDPRAGSIDQNARGLHVAAAARVKHELPILPPLRTRAARAGAE